MSIYDHLRAHSKTDTIAMHMPGHKRNVSLLPDYNIDITEIPGFDNLHHASGIIKESMERASKIYGTLSTYYIVNGSTAAIQAAIHAAIPAGGKLLAGRNCHQSVYNECIIHKIDMAYVYPQGGLIMPEDVEEAVLEDKAIKALIITSPTYDGYVSDIAAIAKVCRKHDIIFIVDEAHGAHLPFADKAFKQGITKENIFPESAISHADVVIQSVHKTLPAMTQTALLHRCSDKISDKNIKQKLAYYQSSSPSYVLMASIEQAIEYTNTNLHLFESFGAKLCDLYAYAKTKADGLLVPYGVNRDLSKIIIDARKLPMTGGEIYDILIDRFGIISEMCTSKACIMLSSICDNDEAFGRIKEAIDYFAERFVVNESMPLTINNTVRAQKLYEIWQTAGMETGLFSLDEVRKMLNSGRVSISGDMISVYPPGFPLVVPGEVIDETVLSYIETARRNGNDIYGFDDDKLEVIYG